MPIASGVAAVAVFAALVRVITTEPMPDFRQFEAGPERKSEFFGFVEPLIAAANEDVREQRQRLLELAGDAEPGWLDRRWLYGLAEDYGVELTLDDGTPISEADLIETLLLRVDTVPTSLALAQAAKESGWGTSRFAREGYNLFGEWCFEEGCGIVPKSRAPGRSHEVQAFASPQASVESYLRNINTHPGYRSFRRARKQQRETRAQLSGIALANELTKYSERRDAYVTELRKLIIGNGLEQAAASLDTAGQTADGH